MEHAFQIGHLVPQPLIVRTRLLQLLLQQVVLGLDAGHDFVLPVAGQAQLHVLGLRLLLLAGFQRELVLQAGQALSLFSILGLFVVKLHLEG